jgi:hypothetical protein
MLVRIQFRCIGGQRVDMEPGMFVEKLPHACGVVRTAPVPEQHDRAPNLMQQMVEKLHHLRASDILLGVETAV